jgi:hypothetical protein
MADATDTAGFLSRWSRRKALTRDGLAVPEAPAAGAQTPALLPAAKAENAPVAGAAGMVAAASEAPPLPAPTLEDAAQLTPASDYTRFVAPGVDANVRNAALKHLFSDPHFNVMDGLDTYIDDYGKPDPLSPGMLRKMAQAEFLNLFADEKKASPETPAASPARPEETVPDEDPALRLQPHDAAGPAGADPCPGTDPGRQH